MKNRKKYSNGQIAVVMTLVMATLLGACALGIDVGILYFNWVKLQKAADASAVAGASYLNGEPPSAAVTTAATTAATNFAKDNGILAAEIVSTTISADGQSMTVNLKRTVPYSFGVLLGLNTGLVSVSAKAALSATSAPKGAIPIGLQCTQANAVSVPCTCAGDSNLLASCNGTYLPYTCQVNGGSCSFGTNAAATAAQTACTSNGGTCTVAAGSTTMTVGVQSPTKPYPLHQAFVAGSTGNWADLNLGGSQGGGTSTFAQEIVAGYNGTNPLQVGDVIYTNTGSVAGPTISAFTTRIGQWLPPNSTPATCLAADNCVSDPQTILIPMVDFSADPSGKSSPVTVTGFAEGYIVGCDNGNGNGNGCNGSSMDLLIYFLGQPLPNNGAILTDQPCLPGNTNQVQACVPHIVD